MKPVLFACSVLLLVLPFCAPGVSAQDMDAEGKPFRPYRARDFSAHRGLFYMFYGGPVLTVDPLGLGGQSTYGVSAGVRFHLWESRAADTRLTGLKVKGFYVGAGYDYYPLQYDKLYVSGWMRVKTFMPITARLDGIYAFGDGMQGTSTRYCFGFEVSRVTVLLAGEIQKYYTPGLGWHPSTESRYANQGSVMLVIPLLSRTPQKP